MSARNWSSNSTICAAMSSLHRDALGEVARLVHVASPLHRHVVGEQLQRDDGEDGHQGVEGLRDGDDVLGEGGRSRRRPPRATAMIRPPRARISWAFPIILSRISPWAASTTVGIAGLDQRDGPVLQLGGLHALGVDVRDLLQLQRALERGGVLVQPPDVEDVARRGAAAGRSRRSARVRARIARGLLGQPLDGVEVQEPRAQATGRASGRGARRAGSAPRAGS